MSNVGFGVDRAEEHDLDGAPVLGEPCGEVCARRVKRCEISGYGPVHIERPRQLVLLLDCLGDDLHGIRSESDRFLELMQRVRERDFGTHIGAHRIEQCFAGHRFVLYEIGKVMVSRSVNASLCRPEFRRATGARVPSLCGIV